MGENNTDNTKPLNQTRKSLRNTVYAALCVVTSRLGWHTSKREFLEGKGEGRQEKEGGN